jgi:hypothetical protein
MQIALTLAAWKPVVKKKKICGWNGEDYKVFRSVNAMRNFNKKESDENLRYVRKPLMDCSNKPCPKMCVTLHAPVCAANDEETKLFGSDCELQNQNECVAKSSSQGKTWKLVCFLLESSSSEYSSSFSVKNILHHFFF